MSLMNTLFSASRTLAVSGAALPRHGGAPLLTPIRLKGTETIGALYEYTLELKTPDALAFSPSIAANIALDKLIGTEVTVSIELEGNGRSVAGMAGDSGLANVGAGTREITGIVTAARILREEGRAIVYSLTLHPWLWLATRNQDCRLFQDMSIVEVTDAVLSAYPFPVEKRLTPPRPNSEWPKRDIQRQHWESDWAFLQRLWEEWGIFYFFEHEGGRHRLVLSNSVGALKPHGPAYRSIRYEAPDGRRIDEEHIHALSVANALTTGGVTHIDYDYVRPRADLAVTQADPRDTGHANHAHYAWGDHAQPQAGATGLTGEYNQPRTEGEYLALVKTQAKRCIGLRASGRGNLRGLTTGQTFDLTHYPQAAANCEYMVISCRLDIEEVGEEAGAGQTYRCLADFEVQPTREAFRLARTVAKPRTYGPETAVVVGPANQEIWTDAYGRVKVQFHWDRQGERDERSSCWLRVSSPWQGNQFGAIHLPRIGQEVIVDHLNGDPDLPIVTGRVVNAYQQPAWQLPDNQALSGFRSRELGNRGGANHLVMDDTEGRIQTQLSSDYALSQLNLGAITRIPGSVGRQDARGSGFELRTDAHGVIRAGKGMLITTEARRSAEAHTTDMGETIERLDEAGRWQSANAGLARQAKAQDADAHQDEVAKSLEKQVVAIRGAGAAEPGAFPELTSSHLVMDGAEGIEATTPGTAHIAGGQHIAITSGMHASVSANGSVLASARDSLRLFAAQGGAKIVAADGDIDIEALSKAINLLAQIEVKVTSDTITIEAKKRLKIVGGGSYIELEQGLIRQGTNGEWVAHASNHHFPQPDEVPVELHVPKVCVPCLLKAAKRGGAIVPRL